MRSNKHSNRLSSAQDREVALEKEEEEEEEEKG